MGVSNLANHDKLCQNASSPKLLAQISPPQPLSSLWSWANLSGPDFYTGRLQFTTPRPERIDQKRVALAHMVSLEGIPWYSRAIWDGELLTIERATRESGTLVCPWQVAPDRWATLVSASLMEREEPYCLPVELCRGSLHRLRERSVAWQNAGHAVSDRCRRLEDKALRAFVDAAMHQRSPSVCDEAVSHALQYTFEAMDQLLEDASPSIGAMRRAMAPRVPPFLGAWAGCHALENRNANNLCRVPLTWGEIADSPQSFDWSTVDAAVDAATAANRRVLLGPLIRWTDEELPNWLGEQVKTFEDLSSHLAQYVFAVAKRYHNRVMVIEVADRVSRPTPLGLEPMQQLQLLADSVRAASNAAPTLPRMVTIGLPFGESMAAKQMELSPLHFADYLLRSEAGLSAIGLQIDCSVNSLGYPARDPFDVAKYFERWAVLGQPLLSILHCVDAPQLDHDTDSQSSPANAPRWIDSPQIVEYVKQMTAVSFANTSVQGVLWCPEEPFSGAPTLSHSEPVADAFAVWKEWLGV